MSPSPEKFGSLLTQGIYKLKSREPEKSVAMIQDELGYAIGRKGGSAIQYWRGGRIPANETEIVALARELVQRGGLDKAWLRAFLRSAGCAEQPGLLAELFPADNADEANGAAALAGVGESQMAEEDPRPGEAPTPSPQTIPSTRATAWRLIALLLALLILVLFGYQIWQTYTRTTQETRSVNANYGWQSTRIRLQAGDTVDIQVIDGTWTQWQGGRPQTSGNGFPLDDQVEYICSRDPSRSDCERFPMPDFPVGALIGKVEGQLFGVGQERTGILIQEPGILLLRMNDDDSGLRDNDGVLTVRIVIEHSP